MNNKQRGFTLIEIVVGIVVLAVALTIVTGVFLPQANKMTSPMYQIKATALGKSIMNQVLIRYYDDVNVRSGSFSPCTSCTDDADLGPEFPESRVNPNNFNDVDDYNVYCDVNHDGSANTNYNPQLARQQLTNNSDNSYNGYGIRICVSLAADKFVTGSTANNVAKRISLTIFMPNNEEITLTSFKGNY
ncbi:type IV pilus modification PilV family protein [Moritella dasanensis]|uniref:type IV pilus modification PilV family protein n=1 Tax=Moritella dasanensis TaxID=428031 RepID=UPI0002F32627|nr:prepilin-type N-terminal cleavage/methylation domain-containing protein [Moritella dasanensis]